MRRRKMRTKVRSSYKWQIYNLKHSDSESDHEDEDEEDVDTGNNFNQEDHINQN